MNFQTQCAFYCLFSFFSLPALWGFLWCHPAHKPWSRKSELKGELSRFQAPNNKQQTQPKPSVQGTGMIFLLFSLQGINDFFFFNCMKSWQMKTDVLWWMDGYFSHFFQNSASKKWKMPNTNDCNLTLCNLWGFLFKDNNIVQMQITHYLLKLPKYCPSVSLFY